MGKRPIIVSILSILVIIGAIFEILAGGSILLIGLTLGALWEGMALILGIFFVVLGLISIFVGIGLWRGKNWARITYIIIGIFGIGMNLYSMIINPTATEIVTGIVGMVLPILIISYLLFSRKVKNYF